MQLVSERHEVADDPEAIQAYLEAREWGDGLPVVPPTLERVERFLAILRADDLHPVIESQDGHRARIVVDGRRFRIRFALPLNPLG